MADIIITLTIPNGFASRFAAVVDLIWNGRTTETKVEWVKQMLKAELKQRVLIAERENAGITEIDIL